MNSKRFQLAALLALLPASVIIAGETIPFKAVNSAGKVIDAAIEAYGGADRLDELNGLAVKSEFVTFATGQSRKPGPPWDTGKQKNWSAIDFENEVFVNKNSGSQGGFEFSTGNIINGEQSWQLNYRAGTAAPVAQPDFHTSTGPLIRVTPALLVKQLKDRRHTSHWLGEQEIDGRAHDIITLVMQAGPALALYFDRESHLLTRSERVFAPFGLVEYRFQEYETISGIPFNRKLHLYANGEDNLLVSNLNVTLNPDVSAWTSVPDTLTRVAALTPDPMSSQEIDEGVFLVGGNNTYALFIEMNDHIVALGGTSIVPAAIKTLRAEISEKPIRYAVLTHHHNDHVPGAAAYAAEGATIVTFRDNEQVVRQAAGSETVKLEFVTDRLSLTDGQRQIELYNIGPTPHAENMLIAWLPKERIIFEADHFPQPSNGVIPPAVPATRAFAGAVAELGLDFRMIVGAHSARQGTPDDLARALESRPVAATGGR